MIKYILFIFAIIITPHHSFAQDYISGAIGAYGLDSDDDSAMDFRLEYRPDVNYFQIPLKPWAGFEITNDLSAWVGGGVLYDWNVGSSHWFITPSLGAGLYTDGDSNTDLDFPIQFRSQIEASYAFENAHRLGLAISHLSNAGLSDENYGTEVMSLYWHVPY